MIHPSLRHTARWLLAVWYALPTAYVTAQTETHPLVAEPKPQGASPFFPIIHRDLRLPVVLNGFCVVTLRERQEWLLGSESHQHVFDGQLYWFAGQRERTIFAATPQRYVPALAGNCIVTFAETGVRKRGNPQHGVLHNQRLFFLVGTAEKKKFQANPEYYAKHDLANNGHCLVSQIDEQRQLPGLPETTVIVDGLRYQFAGNYQKRKFLGNLAQYGVVRPMVSHVTQPSKSQPIGSPPTVQEGSASRTKPGLSNQPAETLVVDLKNKAMGGYCPVTIHEQGTWQAGNARYPVKFDGLTYLMAGEAEKRLFAEQPHAYVPALSGYCVVSEIDTNRRIPGSIYHAAHYEGRLFLFAGNEQKQAFKASPATYMNADLAAQGNCLVSLVDENLTVAGLPELLTWHQGKRYFFASPEQQEKFHENIQRYQEQ